MSALAKKAGRRVSVSPCAGRQVAPPNAASRTLVGVEFLEERSTPCLAQHVMELLSSRERRVVASVKRIEALERTLRAIEPVLDSAVSAACAKAPPDYAETADALDAVRAALEGDE